MKLSPLQIFVVVNLLGSAGFVDYKTFQKSTAVHYFNKSIDIFALVKISTFYSFYV